MKTKTTKAPKTETTTKHLNKTKLTPAKDRVIITTHKLGKDKTTRKEGTTLFLNASLKTGVKSFAPTRKLLEGYINGTVTPKEYTKTFRAKMLKSQKDRPELWEKLHNYKEIRIGCYCKSGSFCHRNLLAGIMFEYLGEPAVSQAPAEKEMAA